MEGLHPEKRHRIEQDLARRLMYCDPGDAPSGSGNFPVTCQPFQVVGLTHLHEP